MKANYRLSKVYIPVMILTPLLILWGCTDAKTTEKNSLKIIALEKKIESIENRMDNAEAPTGFALVSSDGKSYGTAKTPYGIFLITSKGNITPYLDGYKVTLGVGNPTNITFIGAKVNIQWGNNKKQFNELETIFPGRYTYIDFVLTPAKPEDIKIILVSLTFNTLRLP